MRVIHAGGKYYQVNFGMKGLILLNQNPKEIEQENNEFLLYSALISHQPSISLKEIRMIIDLLDNHPDFFPWLRKEMEESKINDLEIEELYGMAIGEMGISLSDFYTMTPMEIGMAYAGYIKRKEMNINLTRLAFANALEGNSQFIDLTDQEYEVGSEEERTETVQNLGIKEEE